MKPVNSSASTPWRAQWEHKRNNLLDSDRTFTEHQLNRSDCWKEMLMVATLLTLALIGFVVMMLANLARDDGAKVIAALQGRSWVTEPSSRPVTLRFSPRYTAARPELARPALRAAA